MGIIIVGKSRAMESVFRFIEKSAATNLPVLIEGDSGTGKELVAQSVHEHSPRNAGQFVAFNCGAMPKELIENELFGHERGAFTGATDEKKGLFEIADKGTLFIDEIGEMDPGVQVKLLRAIETGAFRRLGGAKEIKTEARIVTATNRILENEVNAGRFRLDLYYRLCVLRVRLPALKERKEDIPLLLKHFMKEECHEKHINPRVMEAVMNYSWPGNVRELKNISDRICTLLGSEPSGDEEIMKIIPVNRPEGPGSFPGNDIKRFDEFIEFAEKEFLRRALVKYGENKTDMARALGISRDKLYRKLNKYSLSD